MFLPIFKCPNNEYKNNQVNDQELDFERVVYVGEFSNNEDTEDEVLLSELVRLVKQKEKQILPCQEVTENINLGINEVKREVKIGTSLSSSSRKELIDMLKKNANVFAWSYQDILGFNMNIVVHRLPLLAECEPVKQKLRKVKLEMY